MRSSQNVIYVPPQPGPLVTVTAPAKRSDEIDNVLDDLFGEQDHSGPSKTDAILVSAGVGAVLVGQFGNVSSAVSVVGVGLIGLGIILPIRSGMRRLKERRHTARLASTVGDGVALRLDHTTLAQIAELHNQIFERSARLVPNVHQRFASVAHSLVDEVATLLAGELPVGQAEIEYVEARSESLAELASVLDDPRLGDGDPVRRRAMTEARLEVERVVGGSALTDSAELRKELLPDTEA